MSLPTKPICTEEGSSVAGRLVRQGEGCSLCCPLLFLTSSITLLGVVTKAFIHSFIQASLFIPHHSFSVTVCCAELNAGYKNGENTTPVFKLLAVQEADRPVKQVQYCGLRTCYVGYARLEMPCLRAGLGLFQREEPTAGS